MARKFPSIVLLLAGALSAQPAKDFQSVFAVDRKTLGVKGPNPYFNLTPGYTLSYRHGKDTDTLTVVNETKRIDGVETRAVEDREMRNGRLGQQFYQEQAPGVSMDRCEILSDNEKIVTPAGTFESVVETSPLEKGLYDHKWYAPGVGQVKACPSTRIPPRSG